MVHGISVVWRSRAARQPDPREGDHQVSVVNGACESVRVRVYFRVCEEKRFTEIDGPDILGTGVS